MKGRGAAGRLQQQAAFLLQRIPTHAVNKKGEQPQRLSCFVKTLYAQN